MPTGDGFAIDLNEAEKGCKLFEGSLPQAAAMLREPINDLLTYEGWDGQYAGRFDAVDRMQPMFQGFCDEIGRRQVRGCEIMDETAEALRDIIAIYRRVDGHD